MISLIEWLFLELGEVPTASWDKQKDQWTGRVSVDGVKFEITYWGWGKEWQVQFYQTDDNWGTTREDRPVGMITLVKFFQVLDESLLELLTQHPEILTIKIHPEATSNQRGAKVLRRKGEPLAASTNNFFDPHKFNAYQLVFQHSKLAQNGFSMTPNGENLIISRGR